MTRGIYLRTEGIKTKISETLKGRKKPEEVIEKIKKTMKELWQNPEYKEKAYKKMRIHGEPHNKPHSEETKIKMKENMEGKYAGENSPNWKGGKTSRNKLLRNCSAFIEWRRKVFERDNYTCQMCGLRSQIGQRVMLHPHHIFPLAKFPELVFEISNGQTLCYDCHQEIHSNIKLSQIIKEGGKLKS